MDPGEVPELLARFDAHEESFEKGELLFREGDVPHEVGLALSGALHVMQDDFWGNASIVSEVGEGDLFGASSACDPVPALDTHGLALVPTRALYLDTGCLLYTSGPHHGREGGHGRHLRARRAVAGAAGNGRHQLLGKETNMDIAPFGVEDWLNVHEKSATYDICLLYTSRCV